MRRGGVWPAEEDVASVGGKLDDVGAQVAVGNGVACCELGSEGGEFGIHVQVASGPWVKSVRVRGSDSVSCCQPLKGSAWVSATARRWVRASACTRGYRPRRVRPPTPLLPGRVRRTAPRTLGSPSRCPLRARSTHLLFIRAGQGGAGVQQSTSSERQVVCAQLAGVARNSPRPGGRWGK